MLENLRFLRPGLFPRYDHEAPRATLLDRTMGIKNIHFCHFQCRFLPNWHPGGLLSYRTPRPERREPRGFEPGDVGEGRGVRHTRSILGLAKEEGFELNAVGLRTTAIWHFGNGAKCQVANGAMKVRRLEKGLPPVSWRKALNRLQLLPQLA